MKKKEQETKTKYFLYEVPKRTYDNIRRGNIPFIIIPKGGFKYIVEKVGISQDNDGGMCATYKFKYPAVKICCTEERKSTMCFLIYDARLFFDDEKEPCLAVLLGNQIRFKYERLGDKCEADMKAKSVEFIKENFE